jgi:glyoxylase-like metal-dependent hydrolase (beta-lactamase superfamily II)
MKKIAYLLGVCIIFSAYLNAFSLGKLGDFKFEKMNDNVYIMHGPAQNPSVENEGFMNNPALIVGKNSLIVIDPGGNYNVGKKILKEIEKISKKPIVATINTHKHGDHWFANKALLEKYPNLQIYAHPQMIKEVKAGGAQTWFNILQSLSKNLDGTNNEFPYPNRSVINNQKLIIDGEEFVIRHRPKIAHTNTDIVITHLNSQTMFLGDNVMKNRLGGFDASSMISGNIQLLEEIKKEKEWKLYVPGHGPSGKRDETIDPFLTYMKIVYEEAGKAYNNDQEPYEVKEDAKLRLKAYHNWSEFDGQGGQLGKHLMKAYEEWEIKDME